jgi:uncharacterized protein
MQREEILAVLQAYKKDFSRQYGLLELGVFGSVARNEAGNDSDVDICVKMKTPDPFKLVHVKDDIEKRIKLHVDIIRIREHMNPYLRQRIEKEAIYV